MADAQNQVKRGRSPYDKWTPGYSLRPFLRREEPDGQSARQVLSELQKKLQPLVLYNSREARPGEVDGVYYHFRSRDQIENLKAKDHFVVMDVRGDLQALDLQVLSASLVKGDVFFEGNPFVGRALQTSPALAEVNR